MRKVYVAPRFVSHGEIKFETSVSGGLDFPGVGHGVGGNPLGMGEGTFPGGGNGPPGDVGDGNGHKN